MQQNSTMPIKESNKIEHTTLAEKAYEEIRSRLISARFRPGEFLTIRNLATEFGISATPVREALQRLVAENALEMQPNKSFKVPILELERFEEVRRIRCALEAMAAELAYPNISMQDLKTLENLVLKMDQAIERRDVKNYTQYNEQFHFLIYENSEAPLLLNMIRDLWIQVAPFFNSLFEESDYLAKGNHWHKIILKALKEKDADGVKSSITGDIETAGQDLRKILKDSSSSSGLDTLS